MAAKLFFFGVFLLSAQMALSNEENEELINYCKKEVGFVGDLKSLSLKDPTFPKPAKCVLACLMKKDKSMKDDGSIDKDVEVASIEEEFKGAEKEKMLKSLDDCITEVKALSDKCDIAYEYVKCYTKKF